MKVFVGLLAFVVVASAVSSDSFRSDRQYEYTYKSHSLSGIPLVSNERTGIYLSTKVQLYFETDEKVVLQLSEPEVRRISRDEPETRSDRVHVPELHEISRDEYSELPSDVKETVLTHLRRPIRFTLKRTNEIRDILAEREEPEWALNIKKAIVSHFQTQRVTKAEKKLENVLIGEECEIAYDVTKEDDDKRTVTKVFSLDHCKTPSAFRDVIGLEGHRVDKSDDIVRSSFVQTLKVSEVNNRFFVREVKSEGRITVRPFSPENGELITFTKQHLNFTAEVSKTIRVPTDVVKRSDSLFSHMQSEDNQFSDVYTEIISETQKVDMIKKLLSEYVEKMDSEKTPEEIKTEYNQEMMHAIKLLRSLKSKDSINQIVDYFTKPEREQKTRPMLVSALSFCGSPAVLEALPELKDKLTTYEKNMIITSLPATHVPSKNTIQQLKDLYVSSRDKSTSRQLLLIIGTEVHDLCKPIREGQFAPRSQCDQTVRDEAKKFFSEEYKKTSDETRKLVVLKSIGNSGLDMSEFLRTQIEDNTLPTHLRENAIYALRRVDREQPIRETLLPVYRNEKNLYPVELRIAAFNVLVERIPTEEMLNILVGRLNEEENRQVGNYVYSYLKNLIDLPTVYSPTRNLTISAQNLLSTVERFEDGVWYSKNLKFIIGSISRRFAQLVEVNMINSPSQSLPRSANLKLAKYFAGFYMEVLETGFRFEGLDKLVKEYINYMQPSSDLIKVLAGDRFQREIVIIKSILSEDEIKEKNIEETRGYFFLKHLGNEIGVITTDDFSEIKEQLKTLSSYSDSYFNMKPLMHATIKAQTPIGMPVVADWSVVSALNLKSDKKSSPTEQLLHRSFRPRLVLQAYGRMGVDMGLFKTSVCQCTHSKLTTPFVLRVERDQSKLEIEAYVDTETQEPEKTLLEIASVPLMINEVMHEKDNSIKIEAKNLRLPEVEKPTRWESEMSGVRVTVERHERDFTRKLPLFPFTGRNILRLEWASKPQPIGVKAELTYTKEQAQPKQTKDDIHERKVSALLTLNPKIESQKRELSAILSFKTEEQKPVIKIEVAPKWRSSVYRMFVIAEKKSGQINPAFSWVEAGEDKPIEYTIRAQWGDNKQYDPKSEDLVIKTTLKKSDLQKHFEREDKEVESSDCYKCEQEKQQWRNIECDRCIYKRSWLSQIDSKIFINKEKAYDFEYLESVIPALAYYSYPYYRMSESDLKSKLDMSSMLIQSERPLLTSVMTHMTSDDLVSYRLVHDIHPYLTEQNVTVYYEDKKIVLADIPLIPAFRRLYNLPLNRLTDVFTDRINRPNYGKCELDELNNVHTLDTVVYKLEKKPSCERLLVKDITKDREVEITTTLEADNKRSLKAHFGESLVEIKKTSDSYEVKINNLPKQWTEDKIETEDVRIVRIPVKTPEGQMTHKVELTSKKHMIKCELFDKLVSVKMPFWYKNQLTGLCGDFNGEPKHELRLPNGKVAESISEFVKSQSDKSCRQ
jgi:hypothetical protein